ncbi:MAG: hypothetical protein F6K39_24395 [Okeania sp. SIO3B3]|nr:hypothetical protein [Okeania sp. SIO3B3]
MFIFPVINILPEIDFKEIESENILSQRWLKTRVLRSRERRDVCVAFRRKNQSMLWFHI